MQVFLSARERDVLYWASVGKTIDETAAILGLGSGTVRAHRDHAAIKLGVPNICSACVQAIAQGFVTLDGLKH
jgi:LuxR family quorum-sensing system transcriptional regulator ExpR